MLILHKRRAFSLPIYSLSDGRRLIKQNRRTKKLRFSARRYIALLFVFCLSCLEEEILEATKVMEVEADEFDHRSGIFLSKAFNNIGMMLGIL